MKSALAAGLALITTPALAHPGHVGLVEGHTHVVAALAFGAAMLVAAVWSLDRLVRRIARRPRRTS